MSVAGWALGAALVMLAAVAGYAMARRYGWGAALMLPLLALAATVGMRWQAEGLTLDEGLAELWQMLIFGAPVLLGVVIGIAAARLNRG